jgi:hypothetical protein
MCFVLLMAIGVVVVVVVSVQLVTRGVPLPLLLYLSGARLQRR